MTLDVAYSWQLQVSSLGMGIPLSRRMESRLAMGNNFTLSDVSEIFGIERATRLCFCWVYFWCMSVSRWDGVSWKLEELSVKPVLELRMPLVEWWQLLLSEEGRFLLLLEGIYGPRRVELLCSFVIGECFSLRQEFVVDSDRELRDRGFARGDCSLGVRVIDVMDWIDFLWFLTRTVRFLLSPAWIGTYLPIPYYIILFCEAIESCGVLMFAPHVL